MLKEIHQNVLKTPKYLLKILSKLGGSQLIVSKKNKLKKRVQLENNVIS